MIATCPRCVRPEDGRTDPASVDGCTLMQLRVKVIGQDDKKRKGNNISQGKAAAAAALGNLPPP